MNIVETMSSPKYFLQTFKRRGLLRNKDSWATWKAFLSALFALAMTEEQRAIFKKHTGRTDAPSQPFPEAFVICGRRSGKSVIAALIAVFVSCLRDYSKVLVPGEKAVFMILASDKRQARVIFNYVVALLQAPALKSMVVETLKESVTLSNGITIEIHSSDYRAVRGFTIVGCVADEVAFWPSDEGSANPDTEVLNAVRPAMASVPGAILLVVSSPYGKKGALWQAFKESYGKADASTLVWQSDSRSSNPTLSLATVALAYVRDPQSARAEYGGIFRDDVSTFLSSEIVEACTVRNRFELPFNSEHSYCAFCDPSGGKSDSFTLAIAHAEGDKAVLDVLRERVPPFSPESVVAEFSDTLASYGISTVVGDRYAGEWPREQFSKRGIRYETSELTKSEIFLEVLPLMMSGQCELLDNRKLVNQFCGLERRTARGGRDSVDHGPGSHDDLANAAAGALVLLQPSVRTLGWIEYLKGVAAGLIEMPPDPKVEPQAENPRRELVGKLEQLQFEREFRGLKPVNVETWIDKLPSCPACASGCVIRIGSGTSGNSLHCNSCGANFLPDGTIEVSAPSEGQCCGSPAPQSIPGGMRCANCGRSISVSRADGRPRRSFGRVC